MVLYGMYNDPDNFTPEFMLDAFLHLAEVLLPGEFNELLIGLNIGRAMQASAKVECGDNSQAQAIDVLLHSSIALSRTPNALFARIKGLRDYWSPSETHPMVSSPSPTTT